MTNSTPDIPILDDDAVGELANRPWFWPAHDQWKQKAEQVATSMRSACIEKVKAATPKIVACRPGSQLSDLIADLVKQLELITNQENQVNE